MKIIILALAVTAMHTLPIAVFHGVGDMCINPGMARFTKALGDGVGDVSYCIEIGDGSMSSWFMDFQEQAEKGCANLRKHDSLKGDIIVVGLSQGSLLARYIAESCQFEG